MPNCRFGHELARAFTLEQHTLTRPTEIPPDLKKKNVGDLSIRIEVIGKTKRRVEVIQKK